MKGILAFILCLTSVFVAPAHAEEPMVLPKADFSELRQAGIAEVNQVINPKTLSLTDGRILFLTGLEWPDYDPEEPGEFSMTGLDILRDMLEGQTVTLYQTQKKELGRTNRMDHHIAHLERKTDELWVQGAVVRLGLARMRTSQRNPEMAPQLYALEKAAREEKLGVWESESSGILTPATAKDHLNSYQIVEGTIQSTALKRNRIYLNFGGDWRDDFTVSIAPGDKRLFSRQGIDPLQWGGQTVRVRGWLEAYNGPYMEINHPEAVEMIDKTDNAPSPLPEAPQNPMLKTTD